jgi:hypothetical protein
VLPTGPSGEIVAASSHQGKIDRAQPPYTSTHSAIQPIPCDMPRTNSRCSESPPIHTTSRAPNRASSSSEKARIALK